MKHSNQSKQKHLNPRTFAFFKLSTKLKEQCFDVNPPNICRDRTCEDQFQRALVFAFHKIMVAKNGIKIKEESISEP